MAHISEIWCKYCRKMIGYYVERDKEREKELEKDKAKHESNWCPKRFEEPKYQTEVEKIVKDMEMINKQL